MSHWFNPKAGWKNKRAWLPLKLPDMPKAGYNGPWIAWGERYAFKKELIASNYAGDTYRYSYFWDGRLYEEDYSP